eukprot:258146_1
MSRSMCLYELVFIVILLAHASATSIIFGFHTPRDHRSGSIITLTLLWDAFKYQCNVYPTESNTYYSCNSSTTATTLQCTHSITDNPIHHSLQIDNNDWDELQIQSVTIQIYEHSPQITRNISLHFCIPTNQLSTSCDDPPYDTLDNVSISTGLLIPLSQSENYVQIQSESARCVPENVQSSHTIGKYILVPLAKTWMEAQTYCEETFNSNLASLISDEDVMTAVTIRDSSDEYVDQGIWIGLTDNALLSEEEQWKWIDMTTCNYTSTGLCRDDVHWGPNEPNGDQEEDCAEIGHQYTFGLFNDISCTEKRIFLCNNVSFAPTPQWTMMPSDNLDLKPKHESTNLVIVYAGIAALVLIIIACICLCFFGKKWLKEQIRIETVKQTESNRNCVKDVQSNLRRDTLTLEPGQNINISSRISSADGYVGVDKDSPDDQAMHIALEGYVKDVDEDEDVNGVLSGLIQNVIEESSDSDDLYVNHNPENAAETPTAKQNGELTQGGTFVDINTPNGDPHT